MRGRESAAHQNDSAIVCELLMDGVADSSHPVKSFASGIATFDRLLPTCCAAAKASMDKPCMPAIHFLLLC